MRFIKYSVIIGVCLVLVIIFWWLGFGIHSCYSIPGDRSGGPFCIKDLYRTYSGKLDLERGVYQKYNIVYIGTYRTEFISLWSGSNIHASPWIILSQKWIDVSKKCFVYDGEWFFNKRYKEGFDSQPPSHDLLYTQDGKKIYYVNCYNNTDAPDFLASGNFFSAKETTNSLQESNYKIPSVQEGAIPLSKK